MIGDFNGKETRGSESVRHLYEALGFKKCVEISRFPVIK